MGFSRVASLSLNFLICKIAPQATYFRVILRALWREYLLGSSAQGSEQINRGSILFPHRPPPRPQTERGRHTSLMRVEWGIRTRVLYDCKPRLLPPLGAPPAFCLWDPPLLSNTFPPQPPLQPYRAPISASVRRPRDLALAA